MGLTDVISLPLPMDSEEITFTNFDIIERQTIRIEMIIKGIHFKRVHQRGYSAPAVWMDTHQVLEGPMIVDAEKQKELEAIFQNYCITAKFNPIPEQKEQLLLGSRGMLKRKR